MSTLVVSSLKDDGKGAQWPGLQKLWQDVEKKQARNERYANKVQTFFTEFKQQAEPAEIEVCAATEQWIRHLFTFMPRKTIKGAQREALYEWIEEELSILEANPFHQMDTRALRDQFGDALVTQTPPMAEDAELTEEQLSQFYGELSMMLGEEPDITYEELEEMVRHPEKFQAFMEDYLQERQQREDDPDFAEDDDDEAFDWESAPFDDSHSDRSETRSSTDDSVLALFQTKEIARLYRQLAKQLHPDKEADPSKKEQKKELMQQLSLAKKERNIFQMFSLAQIYLPDYELKLDNATCKQIEQALKRHLTQLNQAFQQLQDGPELCSEVWRKFGGGSKQSRAKAIEQYVAKLKDETQTLESKIHEIRTVKTMQVALRERMQMNAIPDFFKEMMMDFPMDFDDEFSF